MLIKNKSKLERKHPNFANDINIIKIMYDAAVKIINTDLSELAGSLDCNAEIKVKNFFLSSDPKKITCLIPGGKYPDAGFFKEYDKAFIFTKLDHPLLINAILGEELFDKILITDVTDANLQKSMYAFRVGFEIVDKIEGFAEFGFNESAPVLWNYSIEYKK